MKDKNVKTPEIIEESGQVILPLMQSNVQKINPEGVEMGVLENGMPYLSQRGVVKMVGVKRTSFQDLSNDWAKRKSRGIGLAINQLLIQSGYDEDELFIEVESDGKKTYAYTEPVVMALLEHYAFDAENKSEIAQNSFRVLSRAGFRVFVYESTGYQPQREQIDSWRHFHDRVDLILNKVPAGYYCVFQEISGMIVSLIRNDVIVDDKMIPDISVGQHWAKHWKANALNEEFGDRIDYEHNYPEYYDQAKSNPQPAKAYPDESLHIFRRWFSETYLTSKFPEYMLRKTKQGKIGKSHADGLIEIFKPKQIEKKSPLSEHNQALKTALNYNPKD